MGSAFELTDFKVLQYVYTILEYTHAVCVSITHIHITPHYGCLHYTLAVNIYVLLPPLMSQYLVGTNMIDWHNYGGWFANDNCLNIRVSSVYSCMYQYLIICHFYDVTR